MPLPVGRLKETMQAAYDAIYFELKSLIENGTYPYRSMLPSESTLVSQYGCAHNTVRKSLAMLASEGYVQPVHGKGVRITYLPTPISTLDLHAYPSSGIQSYRELSTQRGADCSTTVLLMENTVADDSHNLRYFAKGEPLVHVERVREYEGKRFSCEHNHFRADVVDGITKKDAEYSIYHYIRELRGIRIVTAKRYATFEPANKRDRELLDIDGVSHVVVVRVLAFDGDGLLFESSVVRLHPEAFSMEQVTIQTRVGPAIQPNNS